MATVKQFKTGKTLALIEKFQAHVDPELSGLHKIPLGMLLDADNNTHYKQDIDEKRKSVLRSQISVDQKLNEPILVAVLKPEYAVKKVLLDCTLHIIGGRHRLRSLVDLMDMQEKYTIAEIRRMVIYCRVESVASLAEIGERIIQNNDSRTMRKAAKVTMEMAAKGIDVTKVSDVARGIDEGATLIRTCEQIFRLMSDATGCRKDILGGIGVVFASYLGPVGKSSNLLGQVDRILAKPLGEVMRNSEGKDKYALANELFKLVKNDLTALAKSETGTHLHVVRN